MTHSESIRIERVTTRKQLKEFVQFYYDLYRSCPQAVPFLYSEEMDTLRRDKNPSFECCEADYFLARNADGRVVGRVAAIINRRANEQWQRRQVRFGWFDFVDDTQVSRALLDTVAQWGRERGMTEIAGPLGFIDTDREGMLVEGFDELATMYINYNYPYYEHHIAAYQGFEKDNDYLEYRITVHEVTEKMAKSAELVKRRYGLRVHKFTRNELLHKNYGREVFRLLNATYKDLYGFSQLSERQIDHLVNNYIKIADLNLVTAVMDGDSMVAFGITFPSFTNALQHTRDGRLWPFGWWHLLRALKWHKTDTFDLLLVGVLPQYRQKGANVLIFDDIIRQANIYGFSWAEAMPQMETNKGVNSLWHHLDARQHRRHRVFSKIL